MGTSPHAHKAGRRLIGLALLTLVGVGVLLFPQMRVSYHRWQLERGRDYMLQLHRCWGTGEFLWIESFEGTSGDTAHFDHHLNELVQLGEIRHRRYQLQHLLSRTDLSRHFHRSLYELPSIHWASPRWEEGTPLTLHVWTEWSDADTWDEFMAERDVPDYCEKFMLDGD